MSDLRSDTRRETVTLPCPHCGTLNRVPAARLGQHPKCGQCSQALFAGRPVALDSKSFDRHVGAELPLLVDFWAGWCGPCKAMAPVFEAAAAKFEPRLRLGKVDVDAEAAIAARYQIRSIPTLVLFTGGREVVRQSGAMPGNVLLHWIEQNLPR